MRLPITPSVCFSRVHILDSVVSVLFGIYIYSLPTAGVVVVISHGAGHVPGGSIVGSDSVIAPCTWNRTLSSVLKEIAFQ